MRKERESFFTYMSWAIIWYWCRLSKHRICRDTMTPIFFFFFFFWNFQNQWQQRVFSFHLIELINNIFLQLNLSCCIQCTNSIKFRSLSIDSFEVVFSFFMFSIQIIKAFYHKKSASQQETIIKTHRKSTAIIFHLRILH